MKKQNIFLLLLLFSSSILVAQVEKGKWLFAGSSNLGLDIGKTKYESSDGINSEYKYTQFNFSPGVGYFVIDKLAAGLLIDYGYYKDINQDNNDEWKNTSFLIGPFAKYYIMEYKKIWPYVTAGIGFGSEKTTTTWDGGSNEEKAKILAYRFGGGATYFLNDNVGFELFLGYNHEVTKYESSEDVKSMSSSDTDDYLDGAFKMGVGVVVTFGK